MATCSFMGRLFGPRLRTAATVAATPPPGDTVPVDQAIFVLAIGSSAAAAVADATSAALKGREIVLGFFAIGIAA